MIINAIKSIFLLGLCLVTFVSSAQTAETQITLNKIIEHAENNSLYRTNVDWPSLKQNIYSLSKDADSVSQLKPALDYMLKELNDSHGRVFYNNQYLSYYSGEKKEYLKNIDYDIYNKIQTGKDYPFQTSILKKEIGYVRIVGLPMGDNPKMSKDIQDAVCDLIEKGATKWIIDLRYNGGGNMYPMVEGLTSIIGDAIVGGTQGVTANESSTWEIKNGDFYYDDFTVGLEDNCPLPLSPKVAVLLSNYTASSGEALAVILKNRPNTKFFGNKTMGKITATDWKQIDSLTFMSISVSYYKDRKGNLYNQYVDVDEVINFEPDASTEDDLGIQKAIDWLIIKN